MHYLLIFSFAISLITSDKVLQPEEFHNLAEFATWRNSHILFESNELPENPMPQDQSVPVTFKTINDLTFIAELKVEPPLKLEQKSSQTIWVKTGKYFIKEGWLMTHFPSGRGGYVDLITSGDFEISKEKNEFVFGPTKFLDSNIKKLDDRTIKISKVQIIGHCNERYQIVGQGKPAVIQTFLKFEGQEKHQTNMSPG